MNNENTNPASTTDRSPHTSSVMPRTRPRTNCQRQIDELYDLYDLAMIECLLKRPPSLDSFSGA